MLASTRSIVGLGGLAILVGFGIAAGAAVAGGPAGGAARAAVPPSVDSLAGSAASGGPLSIEPLAVTPASTSGDESAARSADPTSPAPRDEAPVSELAASGIPITALNAYKQAATREARLQPDCGPAWPLLAGIGRVESDHGRFAGAVLHSDGLSTPRVIGIPLNGHGTALIRDTDNGRLDGDTVYDRAVGPMQFIPSTWAGWGVDANGDGVKDPFNIFDATAAAADYLCAAGRDLTTTPGQVQAILSYNHSYDYVRLVMSLERVYASGVGITAPVLPTTPDRGRPAHKPKLPPVDPGTPRDAPPPASDTPSPSPSKSSTSTSPTPTRTYTRTPVPIPTGSSSAPTTSPTPSPTPSPTDTGTPTVSPSTGTDTGTGTASPSGDGSTSTGP